MKLLHQLWTWIITTLLAPLNRERARILAEVLKIQGLMPLLMKQRNGQRWSQEDRDALLAAMKALSTVSYYLMVFVLPGTVFLIPLLAWWLDRRRLKRYVEPKPMKMASSAH